MLRTFCTCTRVFQPSMPWRTFCPSLPVSTTVCVSSSSPTSPAAARHRSEAPALSGATRFAGATDRLHAAALHRPAVALRVVSDRLDRMLIAAGGSRRGVGGISVWMRVREYMRTPAVMRPYRARVESVP